MSRKNKLGVFLTGVVFILSMAGCGVGQDDQDPNISSESSSSLNPQGIQPDIHTNLPPPGNEPSFEELAEDFFEKKNQFDSFSPGLQAQITKNMEHGSSDGGSPSDPGSSPDEDTSGGPDAPEEGVVVTLLGGTRPAPAFDANCELPGDFLCIDQPQPAEGFDEVFTTDAGLDLVARIDLNELAVFGANDPVAVVSVFNSDGSAHGDEKLVWPDEVESTNETDVGRFSTAIPLDGGGKFTVVVSAYRVIDVDEGVGNDLFSKSFTVFRTVDPEIEFVEARTAGISTEGGVQVGDEVEHGEVISSELLQLKVSLNSPFSPGVQVRFVNFDENGLMTGFEAVGDTSNKSAEKEDNQYVYTGTVVLHQGLNKIKMTASIPELEEILGDQAPAPDVLTFEVHNFFGSPRIKIITPSEGTAIIGQNPTGIEQRMSIQFCYTMVPELISTGPGVNPPTLDDDCITGSLGGGLGTRLFVNGRQFGGDEDDPGNNALDYNGAQGIFTARVVPDFGVNLIEIQSLRGEDENGDPIVIGSKAGSFIYGVPLTLIEDGEISSGDFFTPRGVHIDIDKAMVEGDILEMVRKFVNRPETSDLVLNTFKKEAVTGKVPCTETDPPSQSGGSVSVDFIPETFELGSIELTSFETNDDGMFHLGARINGMSGEADMRDLNGPIVMYGDSEISFIPLTLSIARMDVNLGVAFKKNNDGNLELDLKKISGMEVINVIGNGPLGSFVSVNVDRNPFAAGLEFLEQQQGLVRQLFDTTLQATFLCGIENGLNNKLTGVLGKGADLIEDLTKCSQTPFCLSLEFDLLGRNIGLEAALNIPQSEIEFDGDGIHVRDVPIRLNPGSSIRSSISTQYPEGKIASVTRPMPDDESPPQENLTNSTHKLALAVGEDVINQALFAANLAGLLDLDLDANFYVQNEITPSSRLLPLGSMILTQGLDVNLDGDNQNDQNVPVMIRVRTDKTRPPMVTILSEAEVNSFDQREQEIIDSAGTGDPGSDDPSGEGEETPEEPEEPLKHFQSDKKYFRLALSGLELSAFEQEPRPAAGVKNFCNVPVPRTDNPAFIAKGFCPVSQDAKALVPLENVADGCSCDGCELVDMPLGNGEIVSRPVYNSNFNGDPVPIYRVRVGLVLHGEIQNVNREIPAVDRIREENPEVKSIIRAKLVPLNTGLRDAYVTSIEVLENHTGKQDGDLIFLLNDVFKTAIGTHCSLFNEVKAPIPSEFEFDTEEEGLLSDFGLQSLDLGKQPGQLPNVFLDDNRLFLDVLLFADLKFEGEEDSDSDDLSN